MLPHLKKYTKEEKELAGKLFEEGSKIRSAIIKAQPKLSQKEMLTKLHEGRKF